MCMHTYMHTCIGQKRIVGFHRAGDCVLYYMTAGVLTPVLCKKREVF